MTFFTAILVQFGLLVGAMGFDLSPGQPFPRVELPSIANPQDRLSTEGLLGEKWMLHIFASW